MCQFASRGDVEWYVVVGTARDLTLAPRTCSGGSLVLFRISPDGTKLEHVHTVSPVNIISSVAHSAVGITILTLQTPLDDVPVAMEPFQGRLLVGVGRLMRIYDIGKKKMLRKCENKVRMTCSETEQVVSHYFLCHSTFPHW